MWEQKKEFKLKDYEMDVICYEGEDEQVCAVIPRRQTRGAMPYVVPHIDSSMPHDASQANIRRRRHGSRVAYR